MDGVLVDLDLAIENYKKTYTHTPLYDEHPDLIPNIFLDPPPIQNAIESIKKLNESGKYEMVILTAAPWDNPEANTHKRLWIEKYFGKLFARQMIITHRKDLVMGDYLIDDRLANGSDKFSGELLHFGTDYKTVNVNEYPDWDSILKKLL